MAGIALRGCCHVIGRFRQRIDRNIRAAMAGGTVTRRQGSCRASVTHHCGFERRVVLVASVTLCGRWDMCGRLKNSRCTTGHVTRRAGAGGGCWVSKRGSGPHGG